MIFGNLIVFCLHANWNTAPVKSTWGETNQMGAVGSCLLTLNLLSMLIHGIVLSKQNSWKIMVYFSPGQELNARAIALNVYYFYVKM